MKNLNYCCLGCAFAGITNGYEPECNNCARKNAILAARNNEVEIKMFENELFLDINEESCNYNNKKARRMQRRIDTKKYAKKHAKNVPIVIAKLNRIPVAASDDDFNVAIKKCINTAKKAVYRYQISFTSTELPTRETPLIKEVHVANGEIIGLHREGNVFKVKIGFLDKKSKSQFIRRNAKEATA